MSVWFCIPSARPPEEAEKCLKEWRARGYKIALARDMDAPPIADDLPEKVFDEFYPGYAISVNRLIKDVMEYDRDAEWFVTGGDDTLPDPNHSAEEIAKECSRYFERIEWNRSSHEYPYRPGMATFGVMQATGDRWQEGLGGFTNAPIDRVCGSPWMGREFCKRINQGNGPLWHEYDHMFEDEELQCVAEKYGVLWQRRDLVHKHMHWGRGETDRQVLNDPVIPEHLKKWNTAEHWQKSKGIFTRRKAAGFPGSEPL